MTDYTLSIIHRAFNDALVQANLIDFLGQFKTSLTSSIGIIPQKDRPAFYRFIDGLNASANYHLNQREYENFMRSFSITIAYIASFISDKHRAKLSVEISARFKSLISDLRKILRKSIDGPTGVKHLRFASSIFDLSPTVRDRLGLRVVFNSNDNELVFELLEVMLCILGGYDPQIKQEFIGWVNLKSLPYSITNAINNILETPFGITCYKNYVFDPKPNGYKTVQFTLSVQPYSARVPGLQVEAQIRTSEMHDIAQTGSASHDMYKVDTIVNPVIQVDNPDMAKHLIGLEDFTPLASVSVKGDQVCIL